MYRYLPLLTALILLISGCRTTKAPSESFDEIACPAAPDYSDLASWAAHPDKADWADSVPVPRFYNRQDSAAVDVFFIHPTTFFSKKAWNADTRDEKLNSRTESTTIKHQASIFNGVGRVYAPRYRQVTYGAFLVEQEQKRSAGQAFETAYQDVKAAFAYFLENENEGHPLLIASHSQGTAHAIRLIREEVEGTAVMDRLVAAYLPGWPVKRDTFATLRPCGSPSETGCFVSWCTMEWGHEPENPAFLKDAVCVNPITWSRDTVTSGLGRHEGVVMANYNKYFPEKLQAKVRGDYLWATRPKVPGTWVISGHNFHIADYNLFWGNVRANVEERVESYLQTAAEDGE